MNDPEHPERVTPAEAEILRSTFFKLIPSSHDAAQRFYDGVFLRVPEARSLFSQSIEVQGEKFMMMVAVMLDAIDKPDKLAAECKTLGTSHSKYGVTTSMFDAVGDSLLESLQSTLGDAFGPEAKTAWSKLYAIARAAMVEAQKA